MRIRLEWQAKVILTSVIAVILGVAAVIIIFVGEGIVGSGAGDTVPKGNPPGREKTGSPMRDEIISIQADCEERYGSGSMCPEAVQFIYDKVQAYICRNVVCKRSVSDVGEMPGELKEHEE